MQHELADGSSQLTSLAFGSLLGGVPLMLGTGIGSEIREPLGYTIVGGLLVLHCMDRLGTAL